MTAKNSPAELSELTAAAKNCRKVLESDASSVDKAKARKDLAEINNRISVIQAEIEFAEMEVK